jgi:caffeoyl-CoA O-methyltransferase
MTSVSVESQVRNRFAPADVVRYSAAHTSPPDELQRQLRDVTVDRTGGAAGMQSGDDQFLFLEILVRAAAARRAIEVGTFTGYSALAIARGMGPQGRLVCCDISDEWTAIAQDFWNRAGVSDRIELRLGPALETIRGLSEEERFDFAFVDADKTGYPDYFVELVPRLRSGGLLLADNTLQGGRVIGDDDSPSTVAMRAFNDLAVSDERVATVLLPIGDGVTVIQKR